MFVRIDPKVQRPGNALSDGIEGRALHPEQTATRTVKPGTSEKVTFKAPKAPGTYKVGCYYHQSMLVDLIVKGKKGAKPKAKSAGNCSTWKWMAPKISGR